jgi:hypothetical protein
MALTVLRDVDDASEDVLAARIGERCLDPVFEGRAADARRLAHHFRDIDAKRKRLLSGLGFA